MESLAIDPLDPNVVYAGTWHLPWKTTDGGKNWQSIKEGIIDDSDVFSIIIDPANPNLVFASACSGIYKSVERAADCFMPSRDSLGGAANAGAEAGSAEFQCGVCRNHGGALQDQ